MSEVFADAFYYIALLNPKDSFHRAAVEMTRHLTYRIVTTAWVLMEVGDALSAPSIRAHTHRFLEQVQRDSGTVIIPTGTDWFSRGLQLFGERPDKSWSLTDCVSFEVMRDRVISDALSGDHHFVQAGFKSLLADSSS